MCLENRAVLSGVWVSPCTSCSPVWSPLRTCSNGWDFVVLTDGQTGSEWNERYHGWKAWQHVQDESKIVDGEYDPSLLSRCSPQAQAPLQRTGERCCAEMESAFMYWCTIGRNMFESNAKWKTWTLQTWYHGISFFVLYSIEVYCFLKRWPAGPGAKPPEGEPCGATDHRTGSDLGTGEIIGDSTFFLSVLFKFNQCFTRKCGRWIWELFCLDTCLIFFGRKSLQWKIGAGKQLFITNTWSFCLAKVGVLLTGLASNTKPQWISLQCVGLDLENILEGWLSRARNDTLVTLWYHLESRMKDWYSWEETWRPLEHKLQTYDGHEMTFSLSLEWRESYSTFALRASTQSCCR